MYFGPTLAVADPVDVADPVWLLQAEPSLVYLGTIEHRVAFAYAALSLVLICIAVPTYIVIGMKGDMEKFKVTRLQKTLSKTARVLARSIDLEIDKRSTAAEKASKTARGALLEQKDLLFSPMYGKVNEDVMRWWFAVDLVKKLLVSVVVAFGENGLYDYKSTIFLIICGYVVLHSTSTSERPCYDDGCVGGCGDHLVAR